jgi:hypothetical protein
MRRLVPLRLATAIFLFAPALVVGPVAQAAPTGSSLAASPSIVTLITGERVQLTTNADGQVAATVLDAQGSSAPRQVQVFVAAGHTYVVPQEAVAALGRQLDASLFDISAQVAGAAQQVQVEWTDPASAHAIPGLTATSGSDAQVTDPSAFGAAVDDGALTGVEKISSATQTGPGGGVTSSYPQSTLVVHGTDALGKKATFGTVFVVNIDDTARYAWSGSFFDGTVAFSVPQGNYFLSVAIQTSTGTGEYVADSLMVRPQVRVSGTQTVVDANARRDATVHVPIPATPRPSKYYMFQAWVGRTTASGQRIEYTDQLVLGDLNFFVEPTAPVSTGALRWFDYFRLVQPDGSPAAYEYDLGKVATGAVPSHFPSTVTDGELAHIRATYNSDSLGRPSQYYRIGWQPQQSIAFNAVTPFTAPVTQDEYVTGGLADVRWNQNLVVNADEFNPLLTETQTTYQPGEQRNTSWLGAVSHPGLIDPPLTTVRCLACRQGDRFTFAVNPWTDSAGHYTQQWYNSSTLTTSTGFQLLKNGAPLASSAFNSAATVTLDPAPATYQLSVDTTKVAPWWATDAASHTVWTWASAERTGTLPAQRTCRDGTQSCSFEPLIFVDQDAAVDAFNSVPPGTVATVDLYAHHQLFDTTSPAISNLTLSYSTDGSTSWTSAAVTASGGGHFQAQVPVPADATGFVTTRVAATDTAGNTVDDTTTDAFRIGAPSGSPGTGTPPPSGDPAPGSGGAHRACAPTVAPQAACQAEVVPAEQALGVPSGFGPTDLQSAYQLPSASRGSGQTVAIVDAYDNPQAEADLAAYRAQYGLPPCTTANGCFAKVNQSGTAAPLPPQDPGWGLEISLDLDMVSAACPNCHILLVEANSNDLNDLGASVNTAVRSGADAVSNSYAANEFSGEKRFEKFYDHDGVAITVSAGDFGYAAMFPAASRFVTAVGGTSLTTADNARGWDEAAWQGTGSGCSAYIAKPSWQRDPDCPMRMVADVSAVADPATGVAVYDTFGFGGWQVVGGTSVGAPLIAATYALNGHAKTFGPADLYRKATPSQFYDVTSGTNVPGQMSSTCGGDYLCTGLPGYDGPTGLGTPHTEVAF